MSSEMPEVLGMSDRIIVMHEGHLSGEFTREQATQEVLMAAAVGKLNRVNQEEKNDNPDCLWSPLFHESVADGAEIAYRSAGADRDCLDVKPELFHHQ